MAERTALLFQRHLIPLLILLASLSATLIGWQYAANREAHTIQARFTHLAQDNQKLLQQQIERHLQVLYDLRSFVAAAPGFDRRSFETFAHGTTIERSFPSVHMLGYLPLVPQQDKAAFEQKMRREGLPQFQIKASGQAVYLPEAYVYPMQPSVMGNDLYLRPDRREAMDAARDNGAPRASYKTSLDADPQKRAAFVIYLPVYRPQMLVKTVAQRRQALLGFVFETFIAKELVNNTLGPGLARSFDFEFLDSTRAAPGHLLYDTDQVMDTGRSQASRRLHYVSVLQIAGRPWLLNFMATPAYYRANRTHASRIILIGGLIGSLMLFCVSLLLEARKRQNRLHEERNQRFRSLFEQNPDAVYSFDLLGCFSEANTATAEIAGLPVDQLIGRPFTSLIAPEYIESAHRLFKLASAGTPSHGELAIINAAGKHIELSTTNLPILVEGRVTGVFGIAKDTTQRKQAEALNRQMRQFLDAAIENLPTMLFVKEARTLRFIAWNKASEELTGIPREEIIGKTDYDLFAKEAADHFTTTDRSILSSGTTRDIAEEPLNTRHQGIRWLHTRKVPFKMGDAEYLLGISEDITERRQAEEDLMKAHTELENRVKQRTQALRGEIEARKESEQALLESEEKYRSIFEQAPVGIAHIGLDGKWLKVNQKFSEIVGYSAEELASLTYTDITHPDDLAKSLELVRLVKEREKASVSTEKRYIRKDGSEVWVLVTRSAIIGRDDRTQYFLSIIEDITQRKQAEAAFRELTGHLHAVREDERARIAREIHDELGGVLAAVKFDLSIPTRQGDQGPNGAAHRNQETIRLVDNAILALRRIMADLRPSVLDDLGLWAALEWQAMEFQTRMGVATQFRLKGDEIDIEPNRATALFRMVQESLNNVAKHAQATEVKILATTTADTIIIRVRDNGRGFTRNGTPPAKSFGILGMQERAQAFGGVVKINGRPGEGTTVSIKFPLGGELTGQA